MKFLLTIGLAGGLAALPSFAAPQKDQDQAGVAEAIRYEKAKQAAADRQARIEEARERGSQTAERAAPEPKRKAKTTPRNTVPEPPPPPQTPPQ